MFYRKVSKNLHKKQIQIVTKKQIKSKAEHSDNKGKIRDLSFVKSMWNYWKETKNIV